MAAKSTERLGKTQGNEGAAERGARFFRNINAIGAIAFAGAAVVAPPAAIAFNTLAAINAVQAGGFEVARRWAKKCRLKK